MAGTRKLVSRGHEKLEKKAPSLLTRGLTLLIRLYQRTLSPILPRACRFHPTCSEYARQAILKWGPLKGSWLGLKRVVRCNPWNPGGIDPVP